MLGAPHLSLANLNYLTISRQLLGASVVKRLSSFSIRIHEMSPKCVARVNKRWFTHYHRAKALNHAFKHRFLRNNYSSVFPHFFFHVSHCGWLSKWNLYIKLSWLILRIQLFVYDLFFAPCSVSFFRIKKICIHHFWTSS